MIPKWRGYRIRTEVVEVDDNGANTHRLVKVPVEKIPDWDADHDESGNLRQRRTVESDSDLQGETIVAGVKL